MRRLIACAFALWLSPALSQDARVWTFDDNPETPSLEFGVAESDEVAIAFACDPRTRQMSIIETSASAKLNPGPSIELKLTAGSASLDLTGDAIANETDGTVSLEVTGAPNPRLFALLKAGPMLTVEVQGGKQTIPLSGAATYIPTFERLCFGQR